MKYYAIAWLMVNGFPCTTFIQAENKDQATVLFYSEMENLNCKHLVKEIVNVSIPADLSV